MGLWARLKGAMGGEASNTKDDDEREHEEGFIPEAKPPKVVAKRFALLVVVTELADSVGVENAGAREEGIAMRKRALDQLVAFGMTPRDLESAEQRLAFGLHTGQVDGAAVTAAMWRLEDAAVLAWALGLRDTIPPVTEAADPQSLRSLVPTDAARFAEFCEKATIRPLGELLEARNEWAMKFFPVEHQGPGEERSRMLERVRALRWLTEAEQEELCSTPVS